MSSGSSTLFGPEDNTDIRNIMPVTVAQVLQVPEGESQVKVGPRTAHMITLVAKVLSIEEQPRKIIYKIDDMTGPPLEVQMRKGGNEDANNMSRTHIVEYQYVRVVGELHTVKGHRFVSALKVSPIKDLNELTGHILEVIHTHEALAPVKKPAEEKKDKSTSIEETLTGGEAQSTPGNDNPLNLRQEQNMPAEEEETLTGGEAQSTPGPDNPLSRSEEQEMVYQAIYSIQTDGIPFDAICSGLKTLPESTISEHLKFLVNKGHICTTIDDDHFKTTDSM